MKRAIATAAALCLPLTLIASDDDVLTAPDACATTAGRDAVTTAGLTETLAMPVMGGDTGLATDAAGTTNPARVTRFAYADLAPYDRATVQVFVSWELPGDIDLDVYAADGTNIGEGHTFNPASGVYEEGVSFELGDCDAFSIVILSYLTVPQDATLEVVVTPLGDPADVAARDSATTSRYLVSERPGQAGPAGVYGAGADSPVTATFSDERPTAPVSDQVTRPAAGFANYQNPFIPYWHHEVGLSDPGMDIVGPVSAELWVSSPTMHRQPATLLVQLWIDGGLAVETEVEGVLLGDSPTPVLVDLGELEFVDAFSYTLQVAATPVVSTSGNSDEYGNLTHTVWYGGSQHASRLLLP